MRQALESLTIVDKDGHDRELDISEPSTGPLQDGDFAWAQRPFVELFQRQRDEGEPVRIIALKARQLGITTITAGLNFLERHRYEGTNGLTIAHDGDTTALIYQKCRIFRERWPYSIMYPQRSATLRWLEWQMNSSLRIVNAKASGGGRGRTIHFLHGSEVAHWDKPESLMAGLRPSLPRRPGTAIVLESTANGVGNYFHQIWVDALAGKNDYKTLFFPWWRHYEYTMPVHPYSDELDDYEKYLMRLGATREHIEWRRMDGLPNQANWDENFFMQEYPATWQEAFIASGRNVFSQRDLDMCLYPMGGALGLVEQGSDGHYRYRDDPMGSLRIFKWPSKDREWGKYIVAGDPSRTTYGDPSCIQILHQGTLEQVAVWHGRCNPWDFAVEMAKLGYYYNSAVLAPEIEGPGYATIGALMNMQYPNIFRYKVNDKSQGRPSNSFGWSTNYNRKQGAIGTLIGMLHRSGTKIHDQRTYDEMVDYVHKDDGEMGNGTPDSQGGSDGAVMAYAIAVQVAFLEGVFQYQPGARTPPSDAQTSILGETPWSAFREEEGVPK